MMQPTGTTWSTTLRSTMARKTAKQIVDEVVAKVNADLAPQEQIQVEREHYFRCMTIVVPGSKCNCYVGG